MFLFALTEKEYLKYRLTANKFGVERAEAETDAKLTMNEKIGKFFSFS